MRNAEKLYKDKGVLKVSKSTRKRVKRKLFDDETSDTESQTKKVSKKDKSITKNIMNKLFIRSDSESESDDGTDITDQEEQLEDKIDSDTNSNDSNSSKAPPEKLIIQQKSGIPSSKSKENRSDQHDYAVLLEELQSLRKELDVMKKSQTKSSKKNHEHNKENNSQDVQEASTSKETSSVDVMKEKTVCLRDSDIFVSKTKLRSCSTQSVSSFTTDLLSLVFTTEVLRSQQKCPRSSKIRCG